MVLTCIRCNQSLPESGFYTSSLKRGWHICKKCQNKTTYATTKRWLTKKRLEQTQAGERTFENLFGGYTIIILNSVKKEEYRYSIKGTNGFFLQTNDLKVFKAELCMILNGKHHDA